LSQENQSCALVLYECMAVRTVRLAVVPPYWLVA